MKLAASVTLLLALFAFSSPVEAWKPPKGCAKVCVIAPWHATYKCPKYCKSEVCYNKHWAKGVKCLPTPMPSPSSSPSPKPLPKGCAGICVWYPWNYGYKCPHYCVTKKCHHNKGIKCIAKPSPSPTPSPSPLPKGCAAVCIANPWLYKYACPYYCVTKPCYKWGKKGIKCLYKPSPSPTPSSSPKPKPTCEEKCVIFGKKSVRKSCNPYLCQVVKCSHWGRKGLKCTKKVAHKPHVPVYKPDCPNKCVSAHVLEKQGCDELKCQVNYCETEHYGQTYVKCAPLPTH